MTKQYVDGLAGFNSWADDRTRHWLQAITDKQWNRTASSSFESIRQTAIHIVSAEKIWIDFWKGTAYPVYLSTAFTGTKDELLATWETVSLGMKEFMENFPASKLEEPVSFVYPNGKLGTMAYWESFAHIVNHTNYHRGQLVSLLRQAGYDQFSSVDMGTYFIGKTRTSKQNPFDNFFSMTQSVNAVLK